MDKFYIKSKGGNKGQIWMEGWVGEPRKQQTLCEAEYIMFGDKCLIDTIDTPITYRRKGYATQIVKELQREFKEVAPIGIQNTNHATGFWASLGMEDALGEEE